MDVREKLVELLAEKCMETCKERGLNVCSDEYCNQHKEKCTGFYADHLIAHGVTVQELDGCDFCKKFDFAGARAEVNKYGAHISLAICNTKFPDEERFKFCPMCGRKLPQPPKGE